MSVNLSTGLFYDRSSGAMQSLAARLDSLNAQVATGRKLLRTSDDSTGWQRLQGIDRANADGAQDAANVKLAQSVLAQADTTLGEIGDRLNRASELVIQGRTGTNSAPAREAIATELEGILEQIVTLANTKDTRGAPLFGGSDDDAAATKLAGGGLSFASGKASAIPIGDGQSVEATVNAATFLDSDKGDIGSALTAIVVALRADEDIPADSSDALTQVAGRVSAAQASTGARAVRVDLQATQLATAADDREIVRSGIEDADPTETIVALQKTMTILQATQASFSKLSSLSLFSYLR